MCVHVDWLGFSALVFCSSVELVGLFSGAFLDKAKHLFPDAEEFFSGDQRFGF